MHTVTNQHTVEILNMQIRTLVVTACYGKCTEYAFRREILKDFKKY